MLPARYCRYCDARPALDSFHATHQGYDMRGASQLAELHQLLEQRLMIRRLKKDVRLGAGGWGLPSCRPATQCLFAPCLLSCVRPQLSSHPIC